MHPLHPELHGGLTAPLSGTPQHAALGGAVQMPGQMPGQMMHPAVIGGGPSGGAMMMPAPGGAMMMGNGLAGQQQLPLPLSTMQAAPHAQQLPQQQLWQQQLLPQQSLPPPSQQQQLAPPQQQHLPQHLAQQQLPQQLLLPQQNLAPQQQPQPQQPQQPQPWQQQLPLFMGTAAPASIPVMAPPAMAAGAGGVAGAVEPKRQSSMSRTFLPVMGADLDDKIRCSY